jgi:RecA/RadA recombinase
LTQINPRRIQDAKMSKFDIAAIVSDVQKLYSKDKKAQGMIVTGDVIRQTYSEADGVPIPAGHPIRELAGLPCVPYNKIVQISGPPDSGKSTCAGELMASAQSTDHAVVVWDAEDKLDAQRFDKQFKGKAADLVVIKTNEILQGGEKMRKAVIAIKTRYPDAKVCLVWDSVGGSQARGAAERELDSEKHGQPGQDAKENGAVMKMFVGLINKYPDSISILLINQVYAKIGFMQHGDAESGGKKVEFHSSLIIRLKRLKTLTKIVKGLKTKYGILTRATVGKNHLSQSETSLHQLDFEITAKGAKVSEQQSDSDED